MVKKKTIHRKKLSKRTLSKISKDLLPYLMDKSAMVPSKTGSIEKSNKMDLVSKVELPAKPALYPENLNPFRAALSEIKLNEDENMTLNEFLNRVFMAEDIEGLDEDIREKANPSRRIWIPKPGKNEIRPLGIPTITDRAKQTLVKSALEPEREAKFEPNTYGFRLGRSCHDAIRAIFIATFKKPAYVLDADISGCFDNINQHTLLEKLNTTPTLKKIIKGWLKAGVLENRVFQSTKNDTIQWGTISPLLACIALNGLESHLKEGMADELMTYKNKRPCKTHREKVKKSLSVIIYADDFVVLHESEEIVLKAKTLIEEWLKTIGLELKLSKTIISHTLNPRVEQNQALIFLDLQ